MSSLIVDAGIVIRNQNEAKRFWSMWRNYWVSKTSMSTTDEYRHSDDLEEARRHRQAGWLAVL